MTLVCFGDFCFMLASAGIDVACMIQACPDTGGGAESVLRTSGRFPLLPCPRISAYAHLFISTLEVANSLKRPMWKSHRCSKAPRYATCFRRFGYQVDLLSTQSDTKLYFLVDQRCGTFWSTQSRLPS